MRRLGRTFRGKSILEFGAGNGALARHLEAGGNRVTAVEVSASAFAKIQCHRKLHGDAFTLTMLREPFDVFAAVDVLEHLTENDIRLVLREAGRLAAGIFLSVSTRPSGLLGPNGENLHLTVRPAEWWVEAVGRYFDVQLSPGYGAGQIVLEGRRKSVALPREAGVGSAAATAVPYCLKAGYESRPQPEYFHDTVTDTDQVVWQPDVYPYAAAVARRLGARRLIDVGCGHAQKLVALQDEFETIGIDFGDNLDHCRRHHPRGRWLEANLEQPAPWPVSVSDAADAVVICSDVIEHLIHPEALLNHLQALLRHALVAVVSTPERDLTWGRDHAGPPPNPCHTREWNQTEFAALLQRAGLRLEYLGVTRSNDRAADRQTILAVVGHADGRHLARLDLPDPKNSGRAESFPLWLAELNQEAGRPAAITAATLAPTETSADQLLEQAERNVREALALNPDGPEALALLARILEARGRWRELITVSKRLLDIQPGDVDARLLHARAWAETGAHTTARLLFEELLLDDPANETAREWQVKLFTEAPFAAPATTAASTIASPDRPLLTGGPLVSVIVPTHNRPEWLREALESVRAQIYRDFEVIVVNDAGADVSTVVASLAAGDRIRLIDHERNQGLAGARNTGVRAARGKYVAYLDDDDIFHPEHLAVLVSELEATGAGVAYSDAHRAVQELRNGRHEIVSRDIPYSHDFDADRFLVANYVPVICFVHERRCFDEVGYFDESLTTHEDWDLWMRLSRKFAFRHVARVTCEFRWRDDGSSMSSERRADFLRTADVIYGKYPELATGRPDIELRRQQHLLEVSGALGKLPGKPTPQLLRVSIVIPVFNKLELTRPCLEAVHRDTAAGSYEIIVVDNGSTDGTAEFLAAEQAAGRLRTIRNEENLGFSKACNQGIRAAQGGFVLLLNNDTIPLPGWLDALLGEIVTDPRIGAVGACLLYPDGERIQHAGVTIGAGDGRLHPYHTWRLQRLADVPAARESRDCQVCTGACLLIRRSVIDQVGVLDEAYINGFEDVDLCFRIGAAGHRIRYCAGSRVIHHESMTPGRKRHEQANYRRLNERWNKTIKPDESPELTGINVTDVQCRERLLLEPDNPCALALLAQIARGRGDHPQVTALTRRFNTVTEQGRKVPVTVSIIIPVMNNLSLTQGCVSGIDRAGGLTPVEIIVVDNASTDGTRDYLEAQHKAGKLRFIRNAANEGFARACNQGAAAARGRRLLFLNNDTVPTGGWLDALWQVARDPAVGAVGARLLYPDGTIQHAGIGWINGVPDHPLRHQPANHPEATQLRELDMVTGACLLVAGDLFRELGGFDEIYRNGVEDIDLCLRIRAAGRKVVYQPEAVVFHLEGRTAGRFNHVSENLQIFAARWQGWFDQDHRFLAPATARRVRSEKSVLLPPAGMPKTNGKLEINWLGSFLDYGSLSNINRVLTDALVIQNGASIRRVQTSSVTGKLAKPLQSYRGKLAAKANPNATLTVRHAWPPDWSRPLTGKLAVIQPWEFGALPKDWVNAAQDVDAFWVPSNYVRQVYIDSGVPAEKVHVVPNGIDPKVFQPGAQPLKLATNKSFKFLFVGGTIYRKGPDVLLKAYAESFTAKDDVCLVIKDFGGQSVYAGQTLEQQIRELQKQPNAPEILYLNQELTPQELPGLYTACDCLVHPYRGEGFGLPVLEAMACGRPVIVTAGGSTDDFVPATAGYHIPSVRKVFGCEISGMPLVADGWLLEPDAGTLKQLLRHVVANRDEARAKGKFASTHARENWTWNHTANRLAELARQCAVGCQPAALPSSGKRPLKQPLKLELPAVARLGFLGAARELLQQNKFVPAWNAARAALTSRPCHPEALLLLAEIAWNLGDTGRMTECIDRAHALAPNWQPAKQFLKAHSVTKKTSQVALAPLPPAGAPRLSVCLIAKNEEKFLGQCLASVKGIAHQIIVVDTGSTDRTAEIAKAHGAEVHSFTWCDDFSAARNAALAHATGDWVLVLDADEELAAAGKAELMRSLAVTNTISWRLPIVDHGKEAEGCTYVPRLFRNAPGLFYISRVHEQVFSSVEVRREEWRMESRVGTAPLIHHGYTAEVLKDRNKVARNLRLLELAVEEMPGEPNLLMNLGLELIRSERMDEGMQRYAEAFTALNEKPANEITPELRESLLTQYTSHLMKLNRWQAILAVLTSRAASGGPLSSSLHFTLGLAYQELHRWGEAAEQFRNCLDRRGAPSFYLVNRVILGGAPRHCLALALWKSGSIAEAAKEFTTALNEDPTLAPLRMDAARFQIEHGEPIAALQLLHGLVAENGAFIDAWLLGARLALSQPDFIEFARDWTREAIKHHPTHRELIAARGETLLLTQQYVDALPFWRQLNGHPRALSARLHCELMQGEFSIDGPPANEAEVSQEFLNWYRRLIQFRAAEGVATVGERLEMLALVLPSAARALGKLMEQVGIEAA